MAIDGICNDHLQIGSIGGQAWTIHGHGWNAMESQYGYSAIAEGQKQTKHTEELPDVEGVPGDLEMSEITPEAELNRTKKNN